jgi:hypothetical protein
MGVEGVLAKVRDVTRVVITVDSVCGSVSVEIGPDRIRLLNEEACSFQAITVLPLSWPSADCPRNPHKYCMPLNMRSLIQRKNGSMARGSPFFAN